MGRLYGKHSVLFTGIQISLSVLPLNSLHLLTPLPPSSLLKYGKSFWIEGVLVLDWILALD